MLSIRWQRFTQQINRQLRHIARGVITIIYGFVAAICVLFLSATIIISAAVLGMEIFLPEPEHSTEPRPEPAPYTASLLAVDRTLNVYFATNRQLSEVSSLPAASNPSGLIFGEATIRIHGFNTTCPTGNYSGPPTLTAGYQLDQPSTKIINVTLFKTIDDLYEKIRSSTPRPAAREGLRIYVHGFGTDFSSAIGAAAVLSTTSCRTGPTLVFSWPSKGGVTGSLDAVFGQIGPAIVSYALGRTEGQLNTPNAVSKFITDLSAIGDSCGDEIGLLAARVLKFGLQTAKISYPRIVAPDGSFKISESNRITIPLSIKEPRSICKILEHQTIYGQCFQKYCAEQERATSSGPDFADLIVALRRITEPDNVPLELFAHSMGNQVVASGVARIFASIGEQGDNPKPIFERYCLFAADISQDDFTKMVKTGTFSQDVFVFQSPIDAALIISSMLNGNVRTGLGGSAYKLDIEGEQVVVSFVWARSVISSGRKGTVYAVIGDGLLTSLKSVNLQQIAKVSDPQTLANLSLSLTHAYHLTNRDQQATLANLTNQIGPDRPLGTMHSAPSVTWRLEGW